MAFTFSSSSIRSLFNRNNNRYLYQTLTWFPAFVFLFEYGYSISWVQGLSMYPTFSPDYANGGFRDALLLRKWNVVDTLKAGQIVTFRSPTNPNIVSIKRIIAVEHEIVTTKGPYPKQFCIVPEGHVWVEGDGELESYDSNSYGPISKALIKSRVSSIIFPFSRFGAIEQEVPRAAKARVHHGHSSIGVDGILQS